MIIIHQGYVEEFQDKAVMSTDIEIDGQIKNVFVAVDKKFGKYLSPERADYALVGMLAYSLRNKHDIICKAPVTEELLYNICETLIPTLIYSDARNYPVTILADFCRTFGKNYLTWSWHRSFLRRRQFSRRLKAFKFALP